MVVDLLAQGFDVPELSFETIAGHAEELLAKYERLVDTPTEAPVEVVDIATSLLGLQVEFDDLQARLDDRVHGATWLRKGIVMIDHEINPDVWPLMRPRFNFTLAHELGHWILHRRFFVDDDGHSLLFDDEDLPDIICRSTGRRPPSERQADAFAGCLLMPQRLLRPAWRALTGTDGPISDTDVELRTPHVDPARVSFIDGDDEHSPDPRRLLREAFCEPLATQFEVSQEAMRIQLETLGLFEE